MSNWQAMTHDKQIIETIYHDWVDKGFFIRLKRQNGNSTSLIGNDCMTFSHILHIKIYLNLQNTWHLDNRL